MAETDPQAAVQHCHRGGHGTLMPDRGFAFERRAQVVRPRQALADDRCLEGDHWSSSRQGGGDLL